jgi:hypothetical protein
VSKSSPRLFIFGFILVLYDPQYVQQSECVSTVSHTFLSRLPAAVCSFWHGWRPPRGPCGSIHRQVRAPNIPAQIGIAVCSASSHYSSKNDPNKNQTTPPPKKTLLFLLCTSLTLTLNPRLYLVFKF